jgi:hypothetical protein
MPTTQVRRPQCRTVSRSCRRHTGGSCADSGLRMIRRVYGADPLLCDCGATMRVIAFLTDPPVLSQILRHLESRARPVFRTLERL